MAIKFINTLNPVPFGFFSNKTLFQQDADNVVPYVLNRLGDPVLSVELTTKLIWSNFEAAAMAFNGKMIEYQARSNLSSLLGIPTGSIDVNNIQQPNNINLTNFYVHQNLQLLDRLAEAYTAYIGLGGIQDTFSGSIQLQEERQDYNLYTDLVNGDGVPIFDLQPSGSAGKLQIYEVFHSMPTQFIYNSNLSNNFAGTGGVLPAATNGYGPDTRFYVLPLYEDVLRAGMLKTAQTIRRSNYSYLISGRNIRIFPIPGNLIGGVNDKLWIRLGFKQQALPTLADTLLVSGTMGPGSSTNTFLDQTIYGASNPANVPFGFIDYNSLNPWARNWIIEYTLALCKETLGYIRGKYKEIPIPDQTLRLNGDDLMQHAREDKDKLLTGLDGKLESLTYDKLQELETAKAKNMVEQMSYIPLPPKSTLTLA